MISSLKSEIACFLVCENGLLVFFSKGGDVVEIERAPCVRVCVRRRRKVCVFLILCGRRKVAFP